MQRHEAPQRALAARVTTLDEHVVDARRDHTRKTLQGLQHKAAVGVQRRGALLARHRLGAQGAHDTPDDLMMDAELGGDGAFLPVLAEVQPADLDLNLAVDGHHTHSQPSCRRSRKSAP